jgi:photosystem II stability/assembly factor-like uncharacterized protein
MDEFMKLKKQHLLLLVVVLILVISVSSVVLFLNAENGDSPNGNGDVVETGDWIDLSSNINAVATECAVFGYTDYSDVFFINKNEGWVTSSCVAEIYHTSDGGESWEVQTTQFSCTAIWMLSKNEGYAGGTNGRVYRTTDGGKNWNPIGSIGITLTDISFSSGASTGFACGLNSAYARIGPEGVTMIEKITYGDIDSVSATAPDEAIFCGKRLLLHYIDGAMVADQDPDLPGKTYLYTIFMLNKKEGWAAGSRITHTVDGQNWTQQTNPDQANDRGMHDIFFLNENEGWIIGERGLIMHTTNGGATWTVEAEGVTNNYLRGISAPNPECIYICGNKGTLLKYVAD